ncbi:hypothetical protein E0L36_02505 [Streptomyces sp. AJS327]|uniref:hypothetical protein n=1 Tax=Streptomyces sp. AJS327 TaxID=2545265 RepID=UPI0015DD6765|nr:hypothetical protein [Streptomyces sp. AJS327]MBA0049808.1 hypothetical protein [Streptomyces sp. AJS327]
MAASAELLRSAMAPLPSQQSPSKQVHEPVDPPGAPDPDSRLDGSCSCDCFEAPLTSEAPLADLAPLTSEPPLAEPPLTSEPAGTGFGAEPAGI